MVEEVIKETGAILVPPYDHPDIILGQGTAGLELEVPASKPPPPRGVITAFSVESPLRVVSSPEAFSKSSTTLRGDSTLNAVITPLGGGGLLAGTATYFSSKP
jgi:threonine dehydratase